MTQQETLYMMALTRVPSISLLQLCSLVNEMGSATAVYENRHDLRHVLTAASPNTLNALAAMDSHLARAEQELAFCETAHIQSLSIHDAAYPERLRHCPDAPVMLYCRGNADLNARHVVSMVGTRQITDYGKELCRTFVRDLQTVCPDTLVVSGLAYGIDVHCHRAALESGLPTVGVMAHGLEQVYPRLHSDTANQMVQHGGLLSEYMSGTVIEKRHFVQRNRIVAGMADATIVVESAQKGGSLITADIALSYDRQVWAFPGRTSDACSAGCNKLIAGNAAALLTDADAFCTAMGWADEARRKKRLAAGVQQELFADYSDVERCILQELAKADSIQVNILSVKTNLPVGALTGHLFALEMKGAVEMLVGGKYKLKR